ncbi:MAG: PfkB family carbohydrate kinase, partial [Pseudomonadales bacterium]|nr:PfkB family carbohydrate kinase [Pseudomonadales bacterium]
MSKLVNIGSLCIDFVYGVPDIVKSGETLASVQSQIFCGGKGLNQSLAAARAGAEVHHLGAIGDDGFALLDTLRAAGVNTDGVLQLEGPSGQAFIQVDPAGRNAIVISGGSNRRLPASLFDAAVAILEPGDWVLLQNETNDVGAAIRRASAVGAQVALNLAPPDA